VFLQLELVHSEANPSAGSEGRLGDVPRVFSSLRLHKSARRTSRATKPPTARGNVGVVYTNDLLDRVFFRFCIGK
jgi:hypothetical protein